MLDLRGPVEFAPAGSPPPLPAPSPPTGDPASRLLGAGAGDDLSPYLRGLRAGGRVARSRAGWVTARHEVAVGALAAHGLVVADPGTAGGAAGGLPAGLLSPLRWRAALVRAMSGGAAATFRVDVEGWAEGLVDRLPATGVDLVESVVAPLAGMTAGELLGLPSAEWPGIQSWVEDLVPTAGAPPEHVGTGHTVRRRLHDHVESRRVVPGHAVLDDVLAGRGPDGEALTRQEAGAAGLSLLLGGYLTTHAVVAGTLRVLLRRPDQVEVLLARPGGWGTAVDEAMRWDPPVPVVVVRAPAVAGEPGAEVTVAPGVTLVPGERLVVSVAGANRDPEAFDDSDDVDVLRGRGPGARRPVLPDDTGPDRVSAGLARAVAAALVRRLFERHPNARAVAPAGRVWRAGLRDIDHLPVRLGSRA
ncbi:MAG: cytochrome P450 [Kineosporiaceae bacterium]